MARLHAPEKQLVKTLLDSYADIGVDGRPVSNPSTPMYVAVGFKVLKLVKVENDNITVGALLELKWQDHLLTWNPDDFGGITSIVLPVLGIWRPDIVFYNDFRTNAADAVRAMAASDALVTSTGNVTWVPRLTLNSICHFSPNPDGEMRCSFVLGSWVHDVEKIDINFMKGNANVDMTMFEPSAGVSVVKTEANKNVFQYEEEKKYAVITYALTVKKV